MGLGVIGIVALWAGGMEPFIALLMVSLLKKDVGANSRLLKPAVILHRSGGDIHVHPTDGSILVPDGIDGINTFENIVQGVVHRVLARLNGQTLMPHILKCNHLGSNLFLGQLLAGDVSVLGVVRTVEAPVDTVIREVQRGKNDNAVSIKILLDLLGQGIDLLIPVLQLTGKQDRRLPM